jgi:hypothetical protein
MPKPVVLLGVTGIVLFDLLASLASRASGFEYSKAAIGSYLIYLTIGFFAARTARSNPIRAAVAYSAVAALAEATIGWWISAMVGPGKPPSSFGAGQIAAAMVFVVLFASMIGLVGGFLGSFARRSPAT